jgi:hypothetical protein
MKTLHTPGPWAIEKEKTQGRILIRDNSEDETFVATIPHHWIKSKANARLIAAAPELLEALKSVVEKLDISGNMSIAAKEYYGEVIAKATAAIAKATGEPVTQ